MKKTLHTSTRMLALGLSALLSSSVAILAQAPTVKVSTVNSVSNVASLSYRGTFVVGLPLIARVENTTTQNTLANNGLWGWETQRSRYGCAAAFQKSASKSQAPSYNVAPTDASKPLNLKVVDQTGREIETNRYQIRPDGSVDLSALSCGVYFVVTYNETQINSYSVSVLR